MATSGRRSAPGRRRDPPGPQEQGDFNLGVALDVKASPYMVRPEAGVTLPLWRDKIAAEIAAAQNRQRAAESRLSREQLLLAVEFADQMFNYREAARNLDLLQTRLVPKARQSLAVARAGYHAGQLNFFNLIDTERTPVLQVGPGARRNQPNARPGQHGNRHGPGL